MVSVKVLGEWHTLDTLNGLYCLQDLHTLSGSPQGKSPEDYLKSSPASANTIQRRARLWGSQGNVYGYASFIDPEFKAAMDTLDIDIMKGYATGVIHK